MLGYFSNKPMAFGSCGTDVLVRSGFRTGGGFRGEVDGARRVCCLLFSVSRFCVVVRCVKGAVSRRLFVLVGESTD